jgi:hypothetical protein
MTLRKKDYIREGIHIGSKKEAERINMSRNIRQFDDSNREDEQKISDQPGKRIHGRE